MAEQTHVVDMIDAIGANAGAIPKGTKRVAIYLTGSGGVAWTNADVRQLTKDDPQLQSVIRIDQANQSSDIFPQVSYIVVDIEPGAANIPEAIRIAVGRKALGLRTGLYYFRAEEGALRGAVAAAGLESHVDYWAAYWDLDREQAIAALGHNGIKAVQWASPSSNPDTLVPGTRRTLREANVDLSVSLADWPSKLSIKPPPPWHRHKPPKPPVHITAAGVAGVITAAVLAYANAHGAHITHLNGQESGMIDLASALLVGYITHAKLK